MSLPLLRPPLTQGRQPIPALLTIILYRFLGRTYREGTQQVTCRRTSLGKPIGAFPQKTVGILDVQTEMGLIERCCSEVTLTELYSRAVIQHKAKG